MTCARWHFLGGVATIACVATAAGSAVAGEVIPVDPTGPNPFKRFKVDCTYVSRGGPGAEGNELRISAAKQSFIGDVQISDREGKLHIGGTRKCEGPRKPRLDNIDSIALNLDKTEFAFVSVHVTRSVLGPGATRESDGSSELEVSSGKLRGSLEFHLGGSDDSVTSGPTDEDTLGANLTAARDNDVDVRAPGRTGLALFLGDGDDGYSQPAVTRAGGGDLNFLGPFVSGDAGDDVLEGSSGTDFFGGGSGSDTLLGSGGFDFMFGDEDDDVIQGNGAGDIIYAQDGADDIAGGAGQDFIEANDGRHDEIDCGADEDFAEVDRRRDNYSNCEEIRTGRGREPELGPRRDEATTRARAYFRRSG